MAPLTRSAKKKLSNTAGERPIPPHAATISPSSLSKRPNRILNTKRKPQLRPAASQSGGLGVLLTSLDDLADPAQDNGQGVRKMISGRQSTHGHEYHPNGRKDEAAQVHRGSETENFVGPVDASLEPAEPPTDAYSLPDTASQASFETQIYARSTPPMLSPGHANLINDLSRDDSPKLQIGNGVRPETKPTKSPFDLADREGPRVNDPSDTTPTKANVLEPALNTDALNQSFSELGHGRAETYSMTKSTQRIMMETADLVDEHDLPSCTPPKEPQTAQPDMSVPWIPSLSFLNEPSMQNAPTVFPFPDEHSGRLFADATQLSGDQNTHDFTSEPFLSQHDTDATPLGDQTPAQTRPENTHPTSTLPGPAAKDVLAHRALQTVYRAPVAIAELSTNEFEAQIHYEPRIVYVPRTSTQAFHRTATQPDMQIAPSELPDQSQLLFEDIELLDQSQFPFGEFETTQNQFAGPASDALDTIRDHEDDEPYFGTPMAAQGPHKRRHVPSAGTSPSKPARKLFKQ